MPRRKLENPEERAKKAAFARKAELQKDAFSKLTTSEIMSAAGVGDTADKKKGGRTHTVYTAGGALFFVDDNKPAFTIMTGDKPSFMSKPAAYGEVNLYRAVTEMLGVSLSHAEACDSLASKVCPHTLDPHYQESASEKRQREEAYKKNQEKREADVERARKERENRIVRAEGLPTISHKHELVAFRFLTETRRFPDDIAEAIIKSRTAYPSEMEHESRGSQRKYKKLHLICPSINIDSGENYGYADIHLGVDSSKDFNDPGAWRKTFAKNEGLFTESVVPITAGTENTKQVVITESFLDGVAYGVMEGFPEDQAIYSTAGARVPHDVIAYCKKNDFELKMALDNDIAGRRITAGALEACKEAGVKCSYILPENGMMGLNIDSNNPRSSEFFERVREFTDSQGLDVEWEINNETKEVSAWIPTTKASCRMMHAMARELNADRERREKEEGIDKNEWGVKRLPRAIEVSYRNKDWNEILINECIQAEMAVAQPSEEMKHPDKYESDDLPEPSKELREEHALKM